MMSVFGDVWGIPSESSTQKQRKEECRKHRLFFHFFSSENLVFLHFNCGESTVIICLKFQDN